VDVRVGRFAYFWSVGSGVRIVATASIVALSGIAAADTLPWALVQA
jgi:hypothetical protein